MRWIISLIFTGCVSFNFLNAQIPIVTPDKPPAEIVIQPQADSLTVKAGVILQNYLYRISGSQLAIKSEKSKGLHHIFIGRQFLPNEEQNKLDTGTLDDAFMLYSLEKDFYLAGKKPTGDIYAVYSLLEDYLDCMKFTPDEEMIPEKSEISLPEVCRVYNPAFPFRVPHFSGRNNPDFRAWHRISDFSDWGMFVHTFHRLVSPEKYFKAHPEYYSLVNGRRLQDGQLCLSNPNLLKLLIENLRGEIAKQPQKTYWSVSQNDCINYCECDSCKTLYKKYGNISGLYIEMANAIARAFPDKQISTLAYQFTRSAPQNIKPLDNVNIMFCSIECNRSMPLAEDPRSAEFVKDMKDWSRLTDNIFAWDYVVQFKNYVTPFPNFHVLQPNIQFFRDHNVNMMFQQGSGNSWSDLSDLKQYLIAKLLWNPDVNVDSVVTRFITKYYGPAAEFIRKYYDLTHKSLIAKQAEQNLDIYGFPVFYYTAHLTPELLVRYQELMDAAEKAAKADSIFYLRVLRARIPADFAYLDIAQNTNNELVKFRQKQNGGEHLDPAMVTKLDRFVELCTLTGIKQINERNMTPEYYRDFVLRKLGWQIGGNKLLDADIRLLTKSSPKYPVGGEKALTDQLLGGLDFRFNWLGFENEDMVVRIDLKKAREFSRMQMNFLKAVESWVFLPTQITVEVSDDDKNYRALSMRTCPEWHRGFGQPAWIFTDEIILQ